MLANISVATKIANIKIVQSNCNVYVELIQEHGLIAVNSYIPYYKM